MKTLLVAMSAAVLMASGTTLLGQGGTVRRAPAPPPHVRLLQPSQSSGCSCNATIIGRVTDSRSVPVAREKVRPRSLITGAVAHEAETNDNGEYSFCIRETSTYVVEMVVDRDVLGLSNAGTLARCETMTSAVQLPGEWNPRLRQLLLPKRTMRFLGVSAANSITANTLRRAIGMNIAPLDAGDPVSATTPK